MELNESINYFSADFFLLTITKAAPPQTASTHRPMNRLSPVLGEVPPGAVGAGVTTGGWVAGGSVAGGSVAGGSVAGGSVAGGSSMMI